MSGDMFVELSAEKVRELVSLDAEQIGATAQQLQSRVKLLEAALRSHAAARASS